MSDLLKTLKASVIKTTQESNSPKTQQIRVLHSTPGRRNTYVKLNFKNYGDEGYTSTPRTTRDR